jgi:DNA-binding MarR family transcriptional regulator/GNAT superfamily N-acetyltransferase
MTAPQAAQSLDGPIQAMRQFNRFYTRRIGLLDEGHLNSQFSLTEVRVLYEIAHLQNPTATEIAKDLSLDAGYLSRILRSFSKQGMIRRIPSKEDARQSFLSLTEQGRKIFAKLNSEAGEEIRKLLEGMPRVEHGRLISAMSTIETLLGASPEARPSYSLRSHRPGDMGWIVHRHGVLYSQEYGYDEHFEALVAEIVAEFVKNFDSERERCWIAERDGEILGSIFLVKGPSKSIAKLRLLFVEPKARGLGIGRRLVEECVRFAHETGYRKIILWTQSELGAARHIYQKAGFRCIKEEPHHSFGKDLVAETWELEL